MFESSSTSAGRTKRGEGMRDHRAILIEDEPGHAEQKVRECATQRLLRHEPKQPRADEDSDDRDEREERDDAPRYRRLTTVTERARRGAEGDYEQRRSYSGLHRQTCQKYQSGHEEKAAARSNEAGQYADAKSNARRRRGRADQARASRWHNCGLFSPPQHERRRNEHHDAEKRQLHDAR